MTAADLLTIDWSKLIKARGTVTVRHGDGPRLDGLPLLTIAPKTWGDDRLRTEDSGADALAIVADFVAGFGLDEVASRHQTTPAHCRQALAHALIHAED